MARRSKKKNRKGSISGYSPRSKVQTHKYTKGGEFTLDGKDYIGEYHLKDGLAWTGPEPLKPQDNVNTIGDLLSWQDKESTQKNFTIQTKHCEEYILPKVNMITSLLKSFKSNNSTT